MGNDITPFQQSIYKPIQNKFKLSFNNPKKSMLFMIVTLYFSAETEPEKPIQEVSEYMGIKCNVSDYIFNN